MMVEKTVEMKAVGMVEAKAALRVVWMAAMMVV